MKILLTVLTLTAGAHAVMAQFYSLQTLSAPYHPLENPTPLLDEQGRLTSETRLPIYDFFFPLFGDTMTFMMLTPHYIGFERLWEMGAVALAMDVQILNNTEISYVKEGPQRAQTLTVQWKNAGFGNDISKSDFFDAQLTLDEQTGCIEIHFGANRVSYPERYLGLNVYRHSSFDETPTHAAGLSGVPDAAYLADGGHLWGVAQSGTKYQICPSGYLRRSHDQEPQARVAVYPNPATDVLNVQAPDGPLEFTLYDAQGRRVVRTESRQIDLAPTPRGLYYLVVEEHTTGRRFIQSVIKQ